MKQQFSIVKGTTFVSGDRWAHPREPVENHIPNKLTSGPKTNHYDTSGKSYDTEFNHYGTDTKTICYDTEPTSKRYDTSNTVKHYMFDGVLPGEGFDYFI